MRRLFVAITVIAAVGVPSSASAAPRPFGHDCRAENGVRFCPGETLADRVPSFDGAPLDVDVTLPPRGDGPFPTIVMMHGYGGSKTDFEETRPEGDSPENDTTYHWNNNFFAKQGYAVVNPTARGFGRSCGKAGSPASPPCSKHRSYIHLADQRWEARDTQFLLGKLVDQGVSRPRDLGVTGISYGGGQSLELAFLRDRIRRTDDSFAPWRSPKGTRLEIAAAFPRWLWSDLVYSLLPNGRFRDDRTPGRTDSRRPLGIKKESFVNGLFALGGSTGTYCGTPPFVPCTDFSSHLPRFFARVSAGEPPDAEARRIASEIFNHKQGFGLDGVPAPLLLQDGFTDDLFPVTEALRIYNQQRARDPRAPVSLQFGDLGHQRGSNKKNTDRFFNDQAARFLAFHLKGATSRGVPRPGAATTFTQTCPQDAPAAGPFRAGSWSALHPGTVRFSGSVPQIVSSGGGNPATAAAVDPVAGGGDACRTVTKERAPGTAVYVGPRSGGYTLMGLPKVTAEIRTTGLQGELNARLWDIAPDGSQRLVSRGPYRLENNQTGRVIFQLYGNGYRFARGHRPKIELLGKDEGFMRPSNFPFSVEVLNARIELPTLERSPRSSGDPEGGGGSRPACTRSGSDRGEVLRGTRGDDVICAGGGNDTVYGLGGDDVLIGGDGNDVLRGGDGDDDLDGGRGNDQLIGGEGNDTVRGGAGGDGLSGQGGDDALDSADGVGGNDTANGGSGIDGCRGDDRDATTSCE